MRNNNIIVAFKNENTLNTVVRTLNSNGFRVNVECSSGAEVRKQLSYMSGGILICGYNLMDTSIVSLIDDIPEDFSILLIGSYSQINLFDDDKICKLAVPLSKADLIYSVTMLINMNSYTNCSASSSQKADNDSSIITEAKHLLIDKYHMSEEQAHRYIQKKSMDTGTRLVEIAKIILQN